MKLSNSELDAILGVAGLTLAEPYHANGRYNKSEYLLTTCTICGVQAHYRLKYVLDRNAHDERTCRACYWQNWYEEGRVDRDAHVQRLLDAGHTIEELEAGGVISHDRSLTLAEAARLADEHSYDLIELRHGQAPGSDVLVVRCRGCGTQTAQRPGDVRFGCSCGGERHHGGVAYGREVVEVERAAIPTGPDFLSDGSPRYLSASGSACLSWWDHERNGEALFLEATTHSSKLAWWVCPKCGRSFTAPIAAMAASPQCPTCHAHDAIRARATFEHLSHLTVADVPELLDAWRDALDPSTVPVTYIYPCHFECPEGHHPTQTPFSFLSRGCMVCRSLDTKTDGSRPTLRDTDPELSAEWHRALDGTRYTPDTVYDGSRRRVMWRCIACGHEWVATVGERQKRMNNRCPACGKVMGSLAWKYPQLAAEWSPANPTSPWNVKPYGKLDFTPEWVCARDPSHRWRATTARRIRGKDNCPWCREGA